jgi:IPT/TIG domain
MAVLVQFNPAEAATGSGTSQTASGSFPSDTTAGNLLICVCAVIADVFSPATPATPVIVAPLTPGLIWVPGEQTTTPIPYDLGGSFNYLETLAVFYVLNAPSISSLVPTSVTGTTATSSNGLIAGFRLLEYSGIAGSLEATASGTGTNGTPSAGNISLGSPGLLFASATDPYGGSDIPSEGSGFTRAGTGGASITVNENILSAAAGVYSASFGGTISGNWAMVALAFGAAAPTVLGVSPSSGPTAGGTPVTITGTGFLSGATVSFGGSAATSVVIVSSTVITCLTPAHAAGPVTVSVTDANGTGSLADGFTYIASSNFNYIKTFEQDNKQVNTLALDASGVLWEEDVTSNPGVLNVYDPLILPGSFCRSVTAEDEEWMVFSNLIAGTDIPRHGSNLDRISQVGPGAGPLVVGQSGGTNVYDIVASPNGVTQAPAMSDPHVPGHFAVNWSAGPFSTAPGQVLTIYYSENAFYPPDPLVLVGGAVYLDFTAPTVLVGLTGTYIVTSVGVGLNPGGSNVANFFTVQTLSTGNANIPAAGAVDGTYEMTLATLTLTSPALIQVGDQVTLAGVSASAWDGTYTILETVNGGQYQITSTSLTGNVATYNYTPVGTSPNIAAGEQVTVSGCTNGPIVNGTSIFNVTNANVVSATASQFTIALNGANVTTAAEAAQALINGTIFQFDPGLTFANTTTDPIYGNSGGGTATVAGPLGAGVRQAVTIFQMPEGYQTAPSPPTIFENTTSASTLQVSGIAIGPPTCLGRIVGFTGANGGNFFYIPIPVTIQGTGQPTTYTSTVINDNVTTQATFSFTDAVLLAATAIDIEGNDLFNQVELGSAAWNIAYAGRMFYGGENNKIQNLVNPTFDGGYLPGPGGVSPPLGWTVDPTYGGGGSVVPSPIYGLSYQIANAIGSAEATYGLISQSAYQDFYKVPIIEPNTAYSIRVRAQALGAIASGNLVFDLYSPSLARQYGNFTIPLSSLTTSMQLFVGTLLLNTFLTAVPIDLQYRVYVTNIPAGATVLVDRTEPFPTNEPVLGTELQGSYVGNLEAFDGITGPLGVGEQNNQPALGAFINYDILYILKSGSLLSTQDSPGNEPANWTVREVSNKAGVCGINAYDTGEEDAVWANRAGLYGFNGGEPILLSPEIKPTWDAINWLYGNTIWVRRDVVRRMILVGVPMATPNQWLPYAPANANPTSPNVVLMLNYKELNTFNELVERGGVKISYSGKLLAWDMSRKWSIWQIPCPYADFITRPDTTAPLFFCNGLGNSEINKQIAGQLNDNGVLIDSLYTTYGFVKDSERGEFGPLLGAHRNLYKYLDMNLYGSGTVTVRVLPNVLTPTYPYSIPAIAMTNPAQNNVERPINQTANRLFVQLESNTLNSGFNLSSLTVSMVKDPHAPVRGLA